MTYERVKLTYLPMHTDIVASLVCWQAELDKHKATFQPDELCDFMDAYLKVLSSNDKKPSFSGTTYQSTHMYCFQLAARKVDK
jgi:hypothetical protein